MLKIGIVGAGYIGKLHADVYSQMNNVKVVSVCDSYIESAKKLAFIFNAKAFCNLNEMLTYEIDMLDVCLPTHLHRQAVELAIVNKIPVLCEKPMALLLDDAKDMEHLSVYHNVPLMIGHCVRFDINYGVLKHCVDSGLYGSLRMLRLYRNSPIPSWSKNAWLLNKDLSGGIITDLHVHDTDFVSWLLGEPVWVFTTGNDYRIVSIYGFCKTTVWSEASWRQAGGFPFESGYDAEFENATLRFDGRSLVLYNGSGEVVSINPRGLGLDFGIYQSDNPYQNEISYFIQCLIGGAPFHICTASSSVLSIQVVIAERVSMETRKKVIVKDIV